MGGGAHTKFPRTVTCTLTSGRTSGRTSVVFSVRSRGMYRAVQNAAEDRTGRRFFSVRCWGVVKVDVQVDAAASRWGRRSLETPFGVVRVDTKVGAAAPR